MNTENTNTPFRRLLILLLITSLCISAIGCAVTKEKGQENDVQTQQSQIPEADSSKKDTPQTTGGSQNAGKKSAGDAPPAQKPAAGQNGTNLPAASQNTISISAAPSIKQQPEKAEVAVGKPVTFTVSADGTDIKYTWQVDKSDGKGWTDIPDANESSYTVKNAGADQNGWKFRCVVSNDAGKAESAVAALSVDSSVKSKQG